MPHVINALGGGHTDRQTHTHIPMHEPKQFQETRCARPLAARTWFNKIFNRHNSYKLLLAIKFSFYSAQMEIKIKQL